MQAMMGIFDAMKQKLQEKLEHLYEFNYTSSSNYDTALQLAASIAQGLAEVQSGKGFSPASGTFSTQELNMEWMASIQKIAEEKAREAEIEKVLTLQEQEANKPWYQKTATAALEFLQGVPRFSQGFDIAIVENIFGLTPPVSDELENSTSYQAGKLVGNVLSGAWSIVEMFAGLTLIGGSNFLTLVAGLVTAGGAIPIAVPVNGVLTVAGATAAGHGGFVWYNTIQNGKDTLQRFQSSGGGKGTGNRIPSYGKDSVPKGPYREVNGYPLKVKAGAQEKHIPDTPNYKQEVANGKNKSIFYGDNKTAQELLDKFAGKGQLLPNGKKERVDFGKPIGKYYDRDTGQYLETTRGMIHYGKDGAHIVPSEPLKK